MHGQAVITAKPVPPPIPSRKVAADSYTGRKSDTVGPARYNPNYEAARKTCLKTDFAASKSKRAVFEYQNKRENELPSKDIPGPGKYDVSEMEGKKMFNTTGEMSQFASKVPNCKGQKV